MSDKMRMRAISPHLVRPGDIISDEDGELAKVQFIDRSGWKSITFSCIGVDGLPARMSWSRFKSVLIVTDPRVINPQDA